MWKWFVSLWNVPVKNVALKMLVADASVHLHAILPIIPGNHFLPHSESVVFGVCPSLGFCGANQGLALLHQDAFWRPAPGSQEFLPVPWSLEGNGKGKSFFSKMLGPWGHAEGL